ncbi:hypothetical protein AQUSIP_21300 [Aquicella siphonis]|uniref:Uncharacterized protein n=1 Tax=Aquicella siphonis TaxID=254247 RepID=A0A5E4PKD0_9COXI|nr:hypothetical protein AQUSIP_21300 [Aquicella siphonis]
MRHVSAFTIRSEFSRSRIKKYNALPREKKINPKRMITIALIIIVIALTILKPAVLVCASAVQEADSAHSIFRYDQECTI